MAISTARFFRPGAVMDYLDVAKPKGILPHLITAAAASTVAAQGSPQPGRLALTLLGGGCVAAAANSLNSYLDRDIDAMMTRTSKRPLPSGRVAPYYALRLGVALGAAGVFVLSVFVNWPAATLAVLSLAYYALYTLVLKRRTWWAAVAASGIGGVPPLIGWLAVTGRLELTPFLLAAIVVLWTLPHFWSLAMFRKEDYERAKLSVLPETGVVGWLVSCGLLLMAASLLLAPVAHLGPLYLAAASLFGTVFVILALLIRKTASTGENAGRLYRYSIFYIAVLFAAIIADKLAFPGA